MVDDINDISALKTACEELRVINNLISRICRVRETNHIMQIIIAELVKYTDADHGVINLVATSRVDDLVTVVRDNRPRRDGLPFRVSTLISGRVLRYQELVRIDDLDNDARFPDLSSEGGEFKSLLCCPMVVRGEVIGVTTLVRSQDKGPFHDDQCRLVGIVSSQSAQILSNVLLLQELAEKNQLLSLSRQKLREENSRLLMEVRTSFAFENIVAESDEMKRILILASKASSVDSPVLITGPTGTGKELLAKAIHFQSDRRDKPFIVKNCGVKTESLLEAELFGHVKGAFTGADRDSPGLFKEADGGTVFLDEVGDAPLSTQAALLRVLETGEIRPVGSARTQTVNVRIVSATNKELAEEIEKGSFRQDLYYRLNTFTFDLPPLSRRRQDIPPLVHHFLQRLKIKLANEKLSITPEALDCLIRHPWPGNIRQLENEIERAAIVSDPDGAIDVADLSPDISSTASTPDGGIAYKGRFRDAIESAERALIVTALAENKHNILKTSKDLGLTRKGLKDKMVRYGISPSQS
jgi:transcriptional regulator with GAF, ATPase, and Fis domain